MDSPFHRPVILGGFFFFVSWCVFCFLVFVCFFFKKARKGEDQGVWTGAHEEKRQYFY